jgi:gamma-glutamyltranspeptidase / glutathione hydrolase
LKTRKAPAHGTGGMAVTAHPLASAAAAMMMSVGGNAVDAAVAAGVAVTVVEPMMSTILGNSYILVRMASGETMALDCYGCAPRAAYAGMWELAQDGKGGQTVKDNRRAEGYQSPLVGGALKGMEEAHRRYGRLPWADVLAPAIRYAVGGFRASQFYVHAAELFAARFTKYPASAAQFLKGGEVPRVGDLIRREEYAGTLRLVARQGAGVLYGGEVGRLIADDMARNDGLMTLADLTDYQVRERSPLQGSYREHTLTVLPPSCSGGAHVIQMLNIMEGFDIGALGFGTPKTLHVLLEAARIAFADRGRYMGDPDLIDIPLEWLISKAYAAERRSGIDLERALPQPPGEAPGRYGAREGAFSGQKESPHTTHLTVADAEGNIVTTTQTANTLWGSAVTVPGTGLLLNNGMVTLDPRPGRANSVAGGKRGLSTTCPTIISRQGRPWVALGTPGGNRIIPAIVQAISNLIDHGMTLQEAVEAPRCFAGTEQEVQLEQDFAGGTMEAVAAFGHQVQPTIRVAGGMQAIMFREDGSLTGASCWRSDGAPVACAVRAG